MYYLVDRVKWGKWDSGVSGTLEGIWKRASFRGWHQWSKDFKTNIQLPSSKWMPPWKKFANHRSENHQ